MRMPDRKLKAWTPDKEAEEARERMRKRGEEDKIRRDKKAREEPLEVGMKILLKRQVRKKGETMYDPEPYVIINMEGRQVTIKRGSQVKTRESNKLKRYYENEDPEMEEESDQEQDWEESRSRRNQQKPETRNEPQEPAETQELGEPRVEETMEPVQPAGLGGDLQDEFGGEEEPVQEPSQPLNRSQNRTRRAPQRYGVDV